MRERLMFVAPNRRYKKGGYDKIVTRPAFHRWLGLIRLTRSPLSMAKMDDIISRLKGMKGTVYAFPLEHACRSRITEIEKGIKATLGIPVINQGVEQCLEREHVVCIIKRASFRPPPEPTVLLVSDDGIVLGEEILPNRKKAF